MTYRLRNILVAIGLALVAMLLTLLYVSNVRRSAQNEAASVQVYVAAQDVPVGTSGADVAANDLHLEKVPRSDVVPGAISSPAQIDSLVLSAPLYQGDQVTLRRFSDAAAEGIRAQLKGTLRAVQIAGDPNQLLAGTLQAGDHVDLVANLRLDPSSNATATRIVLRDLTVLTAPTDATLTKLASTGSTASVILAVTDTQVQRLFFVIKNADWTLELRPVVGAVDSADQVDTLKTVLGGGAG